MTSERASQRSALAGPARSLSGKCKVPKHDRCSRHFCSEGLASSEGGAATGGAEPDPVASGNALPIGITVRVAGCGSAAVADDEDGATAGNSVSTRRTGASDAGAAGLAAGVGAIPLVSGRSFGDAADRKSVV